MTTKSDEVLELRYADLKAHTESVAAGLAGEPLTAWEKFNDDYDVHSVPVGELFNRKKLNNAYVETLKRGGPGSAVALMKIKLQAEMLQALQRGTVMRYERSRIWAMAAAYSRRTAMAGQISRLASFVEQSTRK